MADAPKHDEATAPVTHAIIGAAFEVHANLGPGLLETAYHEALAEELALRSLPFLHEYAIPIYYKGRVLKTVFRADFLVGDVLVELKSISALGPVQEAQLLHYLRATRRRTGLLLNFGTGSVEVRRMTNWLAPA